MKHTIKKVTALVIMFLFIVTSLASAATTTDVVTIKKVSSITKNAMTLKIKYKKYKNKKVKVMVKATDTEEDDTETKTFEVELDKNGEAKVTMDGLSKDTEYELKAKMKINKSSKKYTEYSAVVKKTTKN